MAQNFQMTDNDLQFQQSSTHNKQYHKAKTCQFHNLHIMIWSGLFNSLSSSVDNDLVLGLANFFHPVLFLSLLFHQE